MSLSYQPIQSRILEDPRVDVREDYTYLIQRSGKQNTYQQIISQNVSNSSLSFTTVPPSLVTFVNRKIFVGVPMRITFTGTESSPGSGLLQIGQHDALKAYPLQNYLFLTSSATINNTSVSINSYDVIEPLLRTNMQIQNQKFDYSLTPTYPDTYQNYSDFENGNYGSLQNINPLTGSPIFNIGANNNSTVSANNNPLGGYGLNYEGGGRGSFPYRIISNGATSAVVEVFVVEQLFLPPFDFGHHYHPGLIGINQINFQFNINPDAISGNLWAHSSAGSTLSQVQVTILGSNNPAQVLQAYESQPTLFMNFVTPYSTDLPPLITYPYYEIIRFPTDTGSVAAGAVQTGFPSNNIQLNSVPNRIYFVVKRRNVDKTYLTTDTYAFIRKLSINYKNRNSILGSASPYDLYNISVHNGVKLTWPEYSQFVGSIVCVNPNVDFGEEDMSVSNGLLENIQLQVNVDFQNINLSQAIIFSFYIICVNEGTFTVDLSNNSARQQIGVISRQEILDAAYLPKVDYNAALNMWGGDIYSSIKSGVKHIASAAKTVAPYVAKAAPYVAKAAKYVPDALALVGLGEGIRPRRRPLKARY